MSAQPEWSPVDDETADLLSLVAAGPMSGHADEEWEEFLRLLQVAAFPQSRRPPAISPNVLRGLVRGHVKPQRIGAYTNRALHAGLIEYTGDWEISTDTAGRNAGKPCRVMRWIGGER
jgi:hypothetical protein